MKKLFGFFALFILLVFQTASAQIPVLIRGLAIDSKGVPLFDGNRNVTFFLYDTPTAETPVWSEQQIVPIEEGVFRVMLGEVNSLDLPFDEQSYWLGMKVDDGEELTPRIRLSGAGGGFRISRKGSDTKATEKAALDRDGVEGPGVDQSSNPDFVILDDLIVDGSACIGFDCVNGESFGFDTIRLKENNLRIRFFDTSSSASFPTNDWQLTANSSANGGGSFFSIDDIDNGRVPFKVEANAPTDALRIKSNGNIGFGTGVPAVEVHIRSGDTPTVRLEQDGSSGFTPQTWDVAGNEAGFFIRDATNGSTLPFRIRPGAPSSVIDIAASGNVGIGKTSPGSRLEIKGSTNDDTAAGLNVTSADETSGLYVRNDGNVGIGTASPSANLDVTAGNPIIRLTDTNNSTQWDMSTLPGDGSFTFNKFGTGVREFAVRNNGNLEISGLFISNGTTLNVPDYVFEPDYKLRSLKEVEDYVSENKHLEGIPSRDDLQGWRDLSMQERDMKLLEKVEELTLHLIAQNKTIQEQNEQLAQARDENAAIRADLEGVKSTLSQLHGILNLPVGAKPAFTSDKTYLDVFRSRVDEYLNGADENGRPVGSARPIELKEN